MDECQCFLSARQDSSNLMRAMSGRDLVVAVLKGSITRHRGGSKEERVKGRKEALVELNCLPVATLSMPVADYSCS